VADQPCASDKKRTGKTNLIVGTPCPCGYYVNLQKLRASHGDQVSKENSGPLLDRVDIHIDFHPIVLFSIILHTSPVFELISCRFQTFSNDYSIKVQKGVYDEIFMSCT
jgi:hypothetical protein